jgi:hypothetical protein|eukprot:CAMPEP_0174302402 /NCGR_PEP_ID=MMETSP0809-20121228/59608_1 /TAXON_ID=73025 ORGANISM="Eutreptiella gymnastica-like, Strain CCMP1594" /NCGR_SAMPLE_ID=MMETSP0809 /ASSEMBLY_ACC=CAM_ASM_000658 /LENGTH=182 /DNA_ID=CAMNT_0015408307 /DNA_START=1668 /DNA_END=2216 /DNA_ORIENTATION=-
MEVKFPPGYLHEEQEALSRPSKTVQLQRSPGAAQHCVRYGTCSIIATDPCLFGNNYRQMLPNSVQICRIMLHYQRKEVGASTHFPGNGTEEHWHGDHCHADQVGPFKPSKAPQIPDNAPPLCQTKKGTVDPEGVWGRSSFCGGGTRLNSNHKLRPDLDWNGVSLHLGPSKRSNPQLMHKKEV